MVSIFTHDHTSTMLVSLLVRLALVVFLARISLQEALPQQTRAPAAFQGAGRPGFEGYNQGNQGFPGYSGLGTGQGFRGNQAFGGVQGFRGQGYPGSDGRYGFNIVDTPDRYGYVSNYPGGRTSFFLLGPNRGPGQQSGWRGSTAGGGGLQGGYRPSGYRQAGWQQPGSW